MHQVRQSHTWSQILCQILWPTQRKFHWDREWHWNRLAGLNRSCMPRPRWCASLPMPASWQPSMTVMTWTTAPPKTTWPTRRRPVNWHWDTFGLRFWCMTKSTDTDRQQPGSDRGRSHSTCAQCCWKRRQQHQWASSRMEGRQAAELDPAAKKCTYNYGKCSYGPRCNFEHVCLLCLQAHPQSDHCQQQATTKQE